MARKFPVFLDITGKKILVYGAGRIASRRVETLLSFAPSLSVIAPEASEEILKEAQEGRLIYRARSYEEGTVDADAFLVLAATCDRTVNERICRECREKGIPVNVCSDASLCDFQFPGVAQKGDLVIGVNAGGEDHHLARMWTEKIRKEVEKDG